uniref:Uncharacterized protein n=1 Tax=Tanacetum cinerariifolium TaxID=118510 RepID=A0A6L2MQT1_TANCI|nr:hypothetical protein [Tanacetum cinerariifolium]
MYIGHYKQRQLKLQRQQQQLIHHQLNHKQSTTDFMLIKRIDELKQIMENLIQDNKHLDERLEIHGARLYTLENLDIPQQVSKAVDEIVTNAVDWAIQASLQNRFKDLPEADMKEILHQRMSSGASRSPGASRSSQVPPLPPPPSSTNQEGQSHGYTAPSSLKIVASAESTAWTTTDTRLRPFVSSIPEDLHMVNDMVLDEHVHSSNDEDIRNAHIPKVNLQQDWWKPLEGNRPATPAPAMSIPSSDLPVLKNNWASALASTYTTPPENSLLAQTGDMAMFMDCVDESIIRHNVSKPLPLGGPPGQMKAAYYLDVGLEQMMPDQMWIEEECKYDIAAMYGISHWWFQRQRFYINKHTSEGNRISVQNHMRILSVVRIEVFSMYGYDYMKKIVLRIIDLNEHIIVERYFKYLCPSDFEDLYLLNLQGHLNHLPPKDKKILTTVVNLWTRHLVIRQRVEDFQLGIESYQTQLNLTKP